MEQEIVIRFRDKNVKVIPIGPSMWGYIYCSADEGKYYRILNREDIPKFSLRKEIEECIGKPRQQGFAPIIDEGDAFMGDDSLYCIVYEIRGTSFTKIATGTNNALILDCIAKVFNALDTQWSEEEEIGSYLMPADIIFHLKHPWILSLPLNIAWPRFEALLEQPERILYMPPEVIRGNRYLIREKNRAFYVCGVMLANGIYKIKLPSSAVEIFRLASTGALFDPLRCSFKLPYWIEKSETVKNAVTLMNSATSADPRIRAGLNLKNSALCIEELSASLNPLHMAMNFRTQKMFQEALNFIADVSVSEKNYQLLLLAAEIADKDLNQPIEAIELYERAIDAAPSGEWSSHFNQLEIILKLSELLSYDAVLDSFISKLDTMVWRNYSSLPMTTQETIALRCAGYFASKMKFIYVQNVLHKHMFDGSTFLWWKFQFTISYAEALIGEAMSNPQKIETARLFLESTKNALSNIMNLPPGHSNRINFSAEELNSYGARLTQMNAVIHKLQINK